MSNLNKEERDFLERGGTIWCVRELVPGAWQVTKMSWEMSEAVHRLSRSQEQAVQLIYLIAELAGFPADQVLHHGVEPGLAPRRLPTLGTSACGAGPR